MIVASAVTSENLEVSLNIFAGQVYYRSLPT